MMDPPHLVRTRPPHSKAIPIRNPISGESLPTPAPHVQPARTLLLASHPAAKDSALDNTKTPSPFEKEEDATDEVIRQSFNIYALPFVPQSFAIINELAGHEINTPAMRQIDFAAYVGRYFGFDFLPTIPRAMETPRDAAFSLEDDVIHTRYELYFRYLLEAEIQSQQQENDSYSLFGHDITISSYDNSQTTYSFEVPGLRENSPYVDEDDIIQLRQLRYDHLGKLFGMEQWLTPIYHVHPGIRDFPR